jgi:hypothetical protein
MASPDLHRHHEGRLTYLFRTPCARGRYLLEGTGSVVKKGSTSPCATHEETNASSTERRVGSPRRGSWRKRLAAEKKSMPGGEPKNRKRSRLPRRSRRWSARSRTQRLFRLPPVPQSAGGFFYTRAGSSQKRQNTRHQDGRQPQVRITQRRGCRLTGAKGSAKGKMPANDRWEDRA